MLARESTNGRETGRVEAFSDGVFAIAITLLVLNIHVPSGRAEDLGQQLLQGWPTYVAYVLSFVTVLLMWVSHHAMFRSIVRVDHGFLLLNGVLLMLIAVVPFPTSLLASYIGTGAALAAAVYSGTFFLVAVCFSGLWWYAAAHGLMAPVSDPAFARRTARRYASGPVLYLVSFALAFINIFASLAIYIALQIFYLFPPPQPTNATSGAAAPRPAS
ncbi:MAG: DUF1211 domain-containing protein [Ktedonobacterales bacterium]|nr:DUF1211 domain-containing protein [Ktedonobacterales bacterium]